MRKSPNNQTFLALLIGLLGIVPVAGYALADSAAQIRLVCERNWPDLPEEQRSCRVVQSTAANKLLTRIETAPETSLEFSIAASCIERAKIKPPAMIDWVKAVSCFRSRFAKPEATKKP